MAPPLRSPALRSSSLRSLAIVATATVSALVAGVGAVGAVQAADALRHAHPMRLKVPKAADGHYWAMASVNGRPIRVLVDTGSSAVALTLKDADSLGVDVDRLAFTRSIATAHGQAQAAPVTLATVSVAGAQVAEVHALVVRQGLDSSLLGMSYLGRLTGFSADRTGLTLTP